MARLDADQLAELIEQRMDFLLDAAGKPTMPKEPPELVEDRMRLFRAIAWGVIEHLRRNPDAFRLDVTDLTPITVEMAEIKTSP